MKWPKIRIKRANVEHALIASSAALVLLLSVSSRNVETEMYEEPLESIPQAEMAAAAPVCHLRGHQGTSGNERVEIPSFLDLRRKRAVIDESLAQRHVFATWESAELCLHVVDD